MLNSRSLLRRSCICLTALGLSCLTQKPLTAEVPQPADSVAEAIGVNTHFGFVDTPYYLQSDQVVGLLKSLGARYYRDGVFYLGGDFAYPARSYEIYNTLAKAGLRADYGLSCAASIQQNAQVLEGLSNVAAIEYPNEYDMSGDPLWAGTLQNCGSAMAQALKSAPWLPLIGPSLVQMSSPRVLGPVPMNVNNLHSYIFNYPPDLNYTPGALQGPDAGSGPCAESLAGHWDCFPGLPFAINNATMDSGNQVPTVITEFGYVTSGTPTTTGGSGYVPAQFLPDYYVREVLWALKNGVNHVFFYALLDDQQDAFGLVNSTLNPKPSFYALKNLIQLFSDAGASSPLTPLAYTIKGGDQHLMHSLFQRRDGTYYLALWLNRSEWDGTRAITITPEKVSVSIPNHQLATMRTMQETGQFAVANASGAAVTVPVTGSPVFLEIH